MKFEPLIALKSF